MMTDRDVTELRDDPTSGYVTLDSIDELTTLEEDVDVPGIGRFRVRALSMEQTLQLQEEVGPDARENERVATTAMLRAGVIQPPINDEDDAQRLIAKLGPGHVGLLVDAISRISGMEQDDDEAGTASFKGGSPTE